MLIEIAKGVKGGHVEAGARGRFGRRTGGHANDKNTSRQRALNAYNAPKNPGICS